MGVSLRHSQFKNCGADPARPETLSDTGLLWLCLREATVNVAFDLA
jgi:hypothetical protein